MNTGKIVTATLVGGIVLFLLGWLVFGMLLHDYMQANTNQCMSRAMDDMVLWACLVAHFAWILLPVMVMGWTNVSGWKGGARIGAIVGLISCIGIDMFFYGFTTFYSNLGVLLVDVIAFTALLTIAGSVAGRIMGPGQSDG